MLVTYLTLDQFLGNLDGSLAEGTAVLATDFRAHGEVGRLVTVGLKQWHRGRRRGGESSEPYCKVRYTHKSLTENLPKPVTE